MKVLILVDQLNWAYHSIAKSLVDFNVRKDVSIDIEHIKGNVDRIKSIYKKYDRFLVMGFQTFSKVQFLPKKKTLTGIHSYQAWDGRKTSPSNVIYPNKDLIHFLNKFLGVNVISNSLFDIFKKSGVKKLHITENGVDTSVFVPNRGRRDREFTVGFSGNNAHDWNKGINEIIVPAAKKVGVNLKVAMRKDGSYLKYKDMPSFYHGIDCYICASSSEGFGLSVVEAGACGIPVISTKTGISVDLIENGVDSFLVDRTVDDVCDKIKILKSDREMCDSFGNILLKKVRKRFDWKVITPYWIDFISTNGE